MKPAGTSYLGNGICIFSVWAPQKENMMLHIIHPEERMIAMQKDEWGNFTAEGRNVHPGTRYFFMPDDKKEYPDPASNYQPEGVHGPSEVIDHNSYVWNDAGWNGLPFKDLILYELHAGTFTAEGTFQAIIPFLDDLIDIGINAIELMPVAQFPGNRNWGYDAVYPYAVQNSYGGPEGLKKLVDACHQKGMAVFLDVIYNHLGPEGNYFAALGPYFTDKYHTPWGDAINFDGDWSDGVREYFSNNPLYWFEQYHIDGLRLDAIHMIYDTGAVSFWELTYTKVKQLEQRLGRSLYMTAESDLNSPEVVKAPELGGFGFTAQWLDDFHHALYVLLDKKGRDRYEDFGSLQQLAKAYTDGFVHSGEYVKFRKRRHGASSAGIPGDRFIVFNLNHDQVGNRVMGERLCSLIDFERLKIAAAAVLLSPYIPMLFMGEEYADDSPFFYFISHSDPDLIRAVREGRKKEFENYKWKMEPPDPQDEKTFTDSKIKWHKRNEGKHGITLQWHKELIQLRSQNSILQNMNKNDVRVTIIEQRGFELHRKSEDGRHHLIALFNLYDEPITYFFPDHGEKWKKIMDSKEPEWMLNKERQGSLLPTDVLAGEKRKLPSLSVTVYSNLAP